MMFSIPGLSGGSAGAADSGGTNHINLTTGEFNFKAMGSGVSIWPIVAVIGVAWYLTKK